MVNPEDYLPPEDSIDAALSESRLLLDEFLDEAARKGGDVIDSDIELSANFLAKWQLCRHLTPVVILDDEPDAVVTSTLYRGFMFGYQALDLVRSSAAGEVPILQFFESTHYSADGIEEALLDYFAARPELSDLLESYEPDIDPTGRYYHHVQTGLGLAALLGERYLGEQHMVHTITALEADAQ